MFSLKEEVLNQIRKEETNTYYVCSQCGEKNSYSTAGYWCEAAGRKIEMTCCENCYDKEPEGCVETFEETRIIPIEEQIEQVKYILNSKTIPYKKPREQLSKSLRKSFDEEQEKEEGLFNTLFLDPYLYRDSIKVLVNNDFKVSIVYDLGKNYGSEIIEDEYFDWCCKNIEHFEESYKNVKKSLIDL